jgi:hypothetical protein
MACDISSGIGITCADLKRVGGLNKRLWLFNMSDLRTPIDVTQATITNLNFNAYASLFKFEGNKYAHSAYDKVARTDFGNVSWEHAINLKVNSTTGTEDQILEALAVAEVGGIVQTNNNEFFIVGGGNGLTCMEMEFNTGQKLGDETVSSIKLVGTETTKLKRFARPAGAQGSILNETLYYLNALSNSNITS